MWNTLKHDISRPGRASGPGLGKVCATAIALLLLLPTAAVPAPNIKPVIESVTHPTPAIVDWPFTMIVTATDADGTIVAYEWSVPGGGGWTLGTEQLPHTFATAGSYPISVRVTDDRNGMTTLNFTIDAIVEPPPVAAEVRIKGRLTIQLSPITGRITVQK